MLKDNWKFNLDHIKTHINDDDTVIMGKLDIDYDVDFSG